MKYIWQLPQHLLALCIILVLKITKTQYYNSGMIGESTIYKVKDSGWGVSLGQYIFVSTNHIYKTILHEYGHSIQSLYFGPIYLLVIGLPSITMNILSVILYYLGAKEFARNYYNRFPENWADKLAGVKR